MNANSTVPKQKPSPRWIMMGAIVLALLAGSAVIYWQFFSNPPQPWRVRWQISRYLKQHSGKSNFHIDFKFPSKQEMAQVPASTAAGAPSQSPTAQPPLPDFDTLKTSYIDLAKQSLILQRELTNRLELIEQKRRQLAAAASTNSTATNAPARPSDAAELREGIAAWEQDLPEKQKSLATLESSVAKLENDLWAWQRLWASQRPLPDPGGNDSLAAALAELAREMRGKFDEAESYNTMYALLGQQLWVADHLLGSANPQHRRVALSIVRQARNDALRYTEDTWLAARLCEGYVWPNLDVADYANARAAFSVENLLTECATVFTQAGEMNNVLRNYQILLRSNPQQADWAYAQIAQAYRQSGDLAEELRYLKQIKTVKNFAWVPQRITRLERQLKTGR